MDPLDMLASPFKLVHRYSPLARELPAGLKRELRFIFGDRVSFDATERAVASKDNGALPRDLVDKVMKRVPYAVLTPSDRGDLLEALRLAERHGLPVTPRGNGTSTNGASVPAEGGIAVDMLGFDRVLAVDKEAMTVTCEPGVTFAQLKAALEPEGLMPLVEPDTPGTSTVGGSVALGRYGLGSAMHGSIGEQCVAATVLAPDRKVDRVHGDDLELVRGMQGATGFLMSLTLKVGPLREMEPFLLSAESPGAAADLFRALAATQPWHLQLLAPSYVSFLEKATGAKAFLQEKHFVMVAYPKEAAAKDLVAEKAQAARAKDEAKFAAKAWALRDRAVALHKLGPTRLVAEVVVNPRFLAEALVQLPAAAPGSAAALDAVAAGRDRVLVRVHLLEDERRMEFPVALGNLYAVLDAAHKLGGHAAYPSLLLAGDARDAVGRGVHARLAAFKKRRDPWEVMNPGKVWPARMRGMPMATLPAFLATQKPLLKALRGVFPHTGSEKARVGDIALSVAVGRALGGELAELSDTLYTCSHCGLCNAASPVVGRWETQRPRGAVLASRALMDGDGRWTPRLQDHAWRQPVHRAGDAVCPSDIPISQALVALRAEVARAMGAPEEVEAMADSVARQGNPLGRPKAQRGAWLPEGFQAADGAEVLYYADSIAAHERPEVARAGLELLRKLGPVNCLGGKEPDSGAAMWLAGLHEAAEKQAAVAMKALAKTGCEVVVTPDAVTADVMRTLWPRVAAKQGIAWTAQVRLASEHLLPALGKDLELAQDVAEAVHLAEPEAAPDDHTRKALAKVKGLKVQPLGVLVSGAHGGTLQAHPEAAELAALRALEAAEAAGAKVVVTSDPAAEAHLIAIATKAKRQVAVVDALELLARAAGIEAGAPAKPQAPAGARAAPAGAGAAGGAGAGAGAAAKPKLSPEELEARKKAALEKARAAKAAREAAGKPEG